MGDIEVVVRVVFGVLAAGAVIAPLLLALFEWSYPELEIEPENEGEAVEREAPHEE